MPSPPAAPATPAFCETHLDRRSELREVDGALVAALAHEAARVVVLRGDQILAQRFEGALSVTFSRERAAMLGADEAGAVLLGWDLDGAPWLAASTREAPSSDAELVGLRALLAEATLPPAHLGPLAEARSVLDWHARHGFCAACGARTAATTAGWRRRCPSCAAEHFPRVDPVAIMLVIDGERCLLGRQPRFAKGMYTCLAGFMEPGETIEAAVRREVLEESGVHVGAVRYHASQPWPFPSSLMIGCHADATTREVVVDATELEDCRWFSREDVAKMADRTHEGGLWLPMPGTLSRRLLDDWLAA